MPHKDGDDYEVGYGRPPKQTRFAKGQSGNPRGRPKAQKEGAADISALLDEPITVKTAGQTQTMSPFEASIRKLAKKAVDGDITAAIKFIRLCEEYDIVAAPPAQQVGGVIVAPKGMTPQEWVESVTEEVPSDDA